MLKNIYSKQYRHLAQSLRLARLKTGLDQSKVAKIIGRTQSYISKIESGQLRVDVLQLKEFAKLYKKDINYFL
jgi:transcriptional regulator with XRE-family HTH domain